MYLSDPQIRKKERIQKKRHKPNKTKRIDQYVEFAFYVEIECERRKQNEKRNERI